MLKLLKNRLHPFSHKSFRYFFTAQSFSLIGTWSHELARAWLVLDLAGTTTALGTLLLFTALPGLLLTLHGGALADRTDSRKLLIICKGILAASALAFYLLCDFGHLQLWMIFVFGLLEGLVNSYDGPAFTSIFARTIPKEDFQQALAIQSTSFHVARMLGPAAAGLLMSWRGPSIVFLFDAISYLVVILVLAKITLRAKVKSQPNGHGKGVLNYLRSMKVFFDDKTKRYKQMQLFLSIILVIPLLNLVFRSYLKQKFELSAESFGYLFSFPALGAMVGAIYMTLVAPKQPIRNLLFGVPVLVLSLLGVLYVNHAFSAAIVLGLAGCCSYLNVASITQSIHLITPDDYRGRFGSIITLAFSSIGPLMSYPVAIYTDVMGFDRAICDFTLLFALGSIILAYNNFLRKPSDVIDLKT